ncbi:MAG: ABC transporter substrate-binding protein [Anaerolineae bacterium]|nr:MAG: ABC transporter substrate-binding protein [Anaerolineae bacterium]
MRKLFTLLALMLALSLAVAACTTATEEPSLEGETVTIFTAAGEEQAVAFQSEFEAFTAETGIEVVVEGSPDFEQLTVVRCEAGDAPDIMNFPQPGLMADLARDDCLVDLGFMDMGFLESNYSDAWIESGKVDGTLYGIWHNADVKSLVWYPKEDFEARGFEIPQTWDELLALTADIASSGETPWCIGIESGGATGWAATDWIEDIMLRTTSVENYDKWTTGELPFSSPEVKNAFEIAGQIFFNPDYVVGGTTGILTTNFGDSPLGLFEPRTCFLHRQASFIPNFFPEGTEVGVDVDYFYLPPIDDAYGKPVLGSGSLLSVGQDRPAVRKVMEFLATPASVENEVREGLFVAPQSGVPLDWYPSSALQGFAEILANADTFRFDGSDLMPGDVGAGSFWTGVTDWIGGADLDEVLAKIDASWPSD